MSIVARTHESVDQRIVHRIRGLGRGALFVPSSFLDLGSRRAVDVALHRLVKKGVIRRLAHGLYDYPKSDPSLGQMSPSIDAIAKALASKDRLRLQPAGAYAANLLRLSEQVPMKAVFLTDGASRRIKVGRREIILKRTTPRNMATAGRTSGLVIQALRYLGRAHVSSERIAHLRQLLTDKDRKELLADFRLAPAWMHPFLRAIAGDERQA
ncbi:MAG: hypothetical protein HYY16_11535 [Planctomycetes bacterium]|nr:hypothetical protein [Planctomycetota bacterium]